MVSRIYSGFCGPFYFCRVFPSFQWLIIVPRAVEVRSGVAEGVSQGRDRRRRAVQFVRRHAVQNLDQIFSGQLTAFHYRPSHNQLRKDRPASNRWPAADRMIFRFRDSVTLDPQIMDQKSSPPRRTGMAGEVGTFHDPAITRRKHMVHHCVGVLAHGFLFRKRCRPAFTLPATSRGAISRSRKESRPTFILPATRRVPVSPTTLRKPASIKMSLQMFTVH
jgi:hypothetical protein